MKELPRWECHNARDARAMVAWVNAKLDQMDTISERFVRYGESVLESDEAYVLAQAIKQADNGDIEPLRRLYPHLAGFLRRPKRQRGKRFAKNNRSPVKEAVYDVKRIRDLWLVNYQKKKRSKDLVTAEQIAADRWHVDVAVVANRMKKSSVK
jgi:hypothetical protein